MPKCTYLKLNVFFQFKKNDIKAKVEMCISKFYFSLTLFIMHPSYFSSGHVSLLLRENVYKHTNFFLAPASVLANSSNRLLNVALHKKIQSSVCSLGSLFQKE